jgi:hypothetical protein
MSRSTKVFPSCFLAQPCSLLNSPQRKHFAFLQHGVLSVGIREGVTGVQELQNETAASKLLVQPSSACVT